MKNITFRTLVVSTFCVIAFTQCTEKSNENQSGDSASKEKLYGGFESQQKWGEHLVTIAGCNDCHTPKKMTAHGLDLDSTLLLSGHPSSMPAPDINRNEIESKGLAVTSTLTAWVGPWGISYAGNLTSDPTGIGNWQESNFIIALREGKYKGMATGRSLMPPMPWPMYKYMTDDELKAIFAYLKSTKPINNVVPMAQSPVLASK
jgi:mono/diheme cytochrome c family protein